MQRFAVNFSNGVIHYHRFGGGSKYLLAIHGFGQLGVVNSEFTQQFPEFTIIAPDLPFHGESMLFDKSQPITKTQVVQIIAEIRRQQDINRFSIIAFSIGARLAWPAVEYFSDVLDEVILVAPDGLYTNFWYKVATGSCWSRALFRYLMSQEKSVQWVAGTGRALRLIDRSTEAMIRKTVHTSAKRQLVYNTWLSLRLLHPDFKVLSESIRKKGMQIQLVIGAKDEMILAIDVKKAALKIPGSQIMEFSCGHHQLLWQYAGWRGRQPTNVS